MRLLSPYRAMWLFALFDLPVQSKTQRKEAARFRKDLLGHGFTMFQFSVYAKYCGTEAVETSTRERIKRILPGGGQVRLLAVTDKQFSKMDIYEGKKQRDNEKPPDQLLLL